MSPTAVGSTIEAEGRARLSISHPNNSGDIEAAASPSSRQIAEAAARNLRSERPRGQSKGRRRKNGAGDGVPARDLSNKSVIADALLRFAR